VAVRAAGLNRADLLQLRGLYAPPPGESEVPGLECAGVVAAVGAGVEGFRPGDRVMALLAGGGQAERVAVPAGQLMPLPEGASFEEGAALPEACLTAWTNLVAEGGLEAGETVLVTGATGGVGNFAVQLARLGGAHVTANVRSAEQAAALRQAGAHEVTVGDEIPASPKYDLVIESVGGRTLGTALAALERGGVCVTLGVSASSEVTFDARQFFVGGRATLYGFYLFLELGAEPAGVGLRRLADLVAAGQLAPLISLEQPWTEIGRVAQDLMARRFPGKAVLAVD
jgi:NADPH:quinone reductase-like Zn-dependent oxidoreductase